MNDAGHNSSIRLPLSDQRLRMLRLPHCRPRKLRNGLHAAAAVAVAAALFDELEMRMNADT